MSLLFSAIYVQSRAEVATKFLRKGSLTQIESSWLRPSAWIDQNGEPRVSLDLDANRIILLDRVENGDGEETPEETIPF